MEKNSLTFLSSRGTGFNTDLKMIQSELTKALVKRDMHIVFSLRMKKVQILLPDRGLAERKKSFAGICSMLSVRMRHCLLT